MNYNKDKSNIQLQNGSFKIPVHKEKFIPVRSAKQPTTTLLNTMAKTIRIKTIKVV